MTEVNASSQHTPAGWSTLTPRIVAHQAEQLVEFLHYVFGAMGDYRRDAPAVLRIGDSLLMVSEAGIREPMPAFLYVYVHDVDDTYQRALQFGANPLEAPTKTPYGDRRAMVKDTWGNTWQIASHSDVAARVDE